MKVYHTVSIDLARDDACVNVPAISGTEGDSGTHVLQIRLLQNGESWPVPDNAAAMISYARLDGTGGTYDTLPDGEPAWQIKDGLLFVELAPACFAVATKPWEEIWLTVTLLQGDRQITTRRIPIVVQRSLIAEGEEGGIYNSFATLLRQYIGDTNDLNTEATGSLVDAINEALLRCENSVVSVSSLRVSQDHELLVTLTNGKTLNAGRVLVPGSIGGVSTVCGIAPNEDGNVPLTADSVFALSISGGWMEGPISMDDSRITNLGDPVDPGDAVCSRWLDLRLRKRNLLENWYFRNIINQRREASYSQSGPAFDRWVISADLVASAGTAGLSLSCNNVYTGMGQFLENPTAFNGQTLTISALLTENTGDFLLTLLHVRGSEQTTLCFATSEGTGLVTASCVIPENFIQDGDRLSFRFGNANSSGHTYLISAVKLELGGQQTLAYEENGGWLLRDLPDYVTELYRCQRFLQVFRTQSLRPTHAEDFRPPMRSAPNLSSKTVGGVTYYLASAEM